MTMKKTLAFLTALTMLGACAAAQPEILTLSSISVSAEVVEGTYDENITYMNYGDHIEITDCYWYRQGTIVIPAAIDGVPVTKIGDGAFKDCKVMTGIYLPDTVTEIGDEAFSGNIAMFAIHLPNNLQSIGDSAFAGIKDIECVRIPSSVQYMGEEVFRDSSLKAIYLGDGITEISAGAFAGAAELEELYLPPSLKRIGSNAFAGCDALSRVTYPGSAEEWNAIFMGSGNEALASALIQCEYNDGVVVERENIFVENEDNWSFRNGEIDAYALTDEHYAMLTEGLSNTQKSGVDSLLNGTCYGCCYGMAVSSILASAGYLDPSDFYEGAECLNDIPLNETAISVVSYYFMTQELYMHYEAYGTDLRGYQTGDSLRKLLYCLEDGSPTLISFFVTVNDTTGYGGGHAIVGYDVEYGSWVYGDTTYDGRVLTYDNNDNTFADEYCLYFNSETYEAVIPAYNEDGVALAFVTDDLDYLNFQGMYAQGTVYEEPEEFTAILSSDVLLNDHTLQAARITDGTWTADGEVESTVLTDGIFLKIALPDKEDGYVLTYDQPQDADTSVSYENHLISVDGTAIRDCMASPDGYAAMTGVASDYMMEIVSNEGYYYTDWYEITVSGHADSASLEMTEDGYLLTSDNLQEITALAKNDNAEASLTFSTDAESVLLYEVNETTLAAAIDTDGDGTFETTIAQSQYLGDVNLDGSADATDASEILVAAAAEGSGNDSGFTDSQKANADVNGDGASDATDAALVLEYAAYTGSGGTMTIEEFLKER